MFSSTELRVDCQSGTISFTVCYSGKPRSSKYHQPSKLVMGSSDHQIIDLLEKIKTIERELQLSDSARPNGSRR